MYPDAPRQGRRIRRPQHRFQLRTRPWQIQPFLIAPVLPGETLRNLLLQSRVVSDPVTSKMIGWWCEYYFFYCKHRDLPGRDDFTQMVLDPTTDLSAYRAAAVDAQSYTFNGALDWTSQCLQRVVEEYFRNEEEAWDAFTIDGLPVAQIMQETALNSATNAADMTSFDVEVYADDQTAGGDDTLMASEVETAMRQYQLLRQHGVTEMSYEDYLRSYGVRGPLAEDPHTPELIRYVREWTMPTNTVEATTGVPSSALAWIIGERADKDRFFSEPGFIFGVTVQRPKVYLSEQTGSVSGLMDSAYTWLPAVLDRVGDHAVSWKLSDMGNGPFPNISDAGGYWIDVRDLLMYGDQFVNFALSETDAGYVALPTATLQRRYCALSDAKNLFVDATADVLTRLRQDGIVSLGIASSQRDYTPTRANNA